MLTQVEALTFERTIDADAAEVFRTFTQAHALRDWLCNTAEVDPRKEGPIFLHWNDGYYTAGIFTEFTKGQSVTFTWRGPDDPEASEVHATFDAKGGATAVTVKHVGITSENRNRITTIWEEGLENLQSVVETGIDLRFARRPMFGLSGADLLDADMAERLGVPVTEGMRLTGLVEGMGAAKAGIQKDDVVVSIDGVPANNFGSIGLALQPHKAGDKIPVVIYRGQEQHTIIVELSPRPMPEIPATNEELAAKARELYTKLDAEIEQAFEGVSDAEASHRSAPGEWNAREVLCHLIAIERDNQAWLTSIVEDVDAGQIFHTNELSRLVALSNIYRSVPALLQELKTNEAITLDQIANLPQAGLKHKHLYYQFARWLTEFEQHTREHIDEIKRLVEAARAG